MILRDSDFGQVLDGGRRLGEVLLPSRYVDAEIEPGDEIDVFLYVDSEDRPVATTERPLAQAGEFAVLEVKEITRVGAFLDWGLPKDLLLPRSEQKGILRCGDRVVVLVKFDRVSGRMMATQRLVAPRGVEPPDLQPGQKVAALIATSSRLGWTAVVNDHYLGLIYHNEIFRPLEQGDRVDAYVKEIREEDGGIDLSLQAPGYVGKIPPLSNRIVHQLEAAPQGFLPLHDNSDPDEIRAAFACSKRNFKQAVGALYRQGLVELEAGGIRLRSKPAKARSSRGHSAHRPGER